MGVGGVVVGWFGKGVVVAAMRMMMMMWREVWNMLGWGDFDCVVAATVVVVVDWAAPDSAATATIAAPPWGSFPPLADECSYSDSIPPMLAGWVEEASASPSWIPNRRCFRLDRERSIWGVDGRCR